MGYDEIEWNIENTWENSDHCSAVISHLDNSDGSTYVVLIKRKEDCQKTG